VGLYALSTENRALIVPRKLSVSLSLCLTVSLSQGRKVPHQLSLYLSLSTSLSFSRNELLGTTEILLRDLLHLGDDGHVTNKTFVKTCGVYFEGDAGTLFSKSSI
jgi:hypothetical protein